MNNDDTGDLLGGQPIQPSNVFVSSYLFLFIAVILLAILARPFYIRHREASYKRQIRRKYGIPDDDNDVFNVAYARAIRKKKEEEECKILQAQNKNKTTDSQPNGHSKLENGNVDSNSSGQNLTNTNTISSTLTKRNVQRQAQDQEQDSAFQRWQNSFPTGTREQSVNKTRLPNDSPESRHTMPGSASPVVLAPLNDTRTTAYTQEQLECGVDVNDHDVDISMVTSADDISFDASPRRGSKRHHVSSEDYRSTVDRKKPRRHLEKSNSLMDLDEENEDRDQLMDLDMVARGRKRDRAEAGSTFGIDEDSPYAQGRKVRRRKRKSGIDGHGPDLRGVKRSLDVESTLDSDGDNSPTKISRKRGKRRESTPDRYIDLSVEIEPACGDRQIGEEWHANGQLWRVGPKGQRQRQVLVKKRRSRYSMPVDSQHPDTQAQLVVFVERWVDDEEYNELEEHGEIFTPKDEPIDNVNVGSLGSHFASGKQLLWQSPKRDVLSPRLLLKNSVVTNVNPNVNPFEEPMLSKFGRRVSAGPAVFRVSTAESPLLRHSKSYSKWEKQELEADAMGKLRKRLEEQKRLTASVDTKHVSFELPKSLSAPSISKSVSNVSDSKTTPPLSSVPPSAVESVGSVPSPATDTNKPATAVLSVNPLFSNQGSSLSQGIAQTNNGSTSKQSSATATEQLPKPTTSFGTNWSTPGVKPTPAPVSSTEPPKGTASAPTATSSFGDKNKSTLAASPFPTPVAPEKTGSTIQSPFALPSSSGAPSGIFSSKGAASLASGTTPAASLSPFAPTTSATAPVQNATANIFGSKPAVGAGGTANINSSGTGFSKGLFSNTSTQSPFAFATPAASNSDKTPTAKADDAKSGVSATDVPKFSFSKPSVLASMTPTVPPPMEASKVGSIATTGSTPSPFKFNVSAPQTTTTASTSAPKFSFGITPPPTGQASTAPPVAAPVNKPEITVTSPAGTSQLAAPSADTATSKPTTSPFFSAPKSGDVPKPLFGTGPSVTPIAKAPMSENKQDKPAFSFNFGAPSVGFAKPSSFGTPPTNPPTSVVPPASTATPSTSAFGAKSSTTSPFSFGSTAPASTPSTTFSFAPSTNATAPTQPQNIFGTNASSTPNTNVAPFGSQTPFVPQNTSSPNPFGAPVAPGSGTPFSFSGNMTNSKS